MRWLLLLPLLLVLVLFAVSNRGEVTLFLWPLDVAWVAPLSVAVLIAAAVAFLFGALIAWMASLPYRRRARRLQDLTQSLESQLHELRASQAREVGPVPPVVTGRSVAVRT